MTWIDSLTEAVDVLEIAAREPEPRGRRVAVVTNAGGPAVLATDALHAAGLPPAAPPADLAAGLAAILPAGATIDNPLDLLAPARPEDYTAALGALDASGAYDGVLVLFMHPIITDARAIAGAILAHASASSGFTVVGWLGGPELERPASTLRAGGVPVIEEPTRAGRALARWLDLHRPRGDRHPRPETNPAPGRRWPAASPGWTGTTWGDPGTLERFLAGDPIRIPEHCRVEDRAAAETAAREMEAPLVLKLESGSQPHKVRAGRLARVETGADLSAALETLGVAADGEPGRWLIQRRVPPGPEFFAGYLRHPRLGSFVSLGPGGSAVETTPPVWIGLPAGVPVLAELADRWSTTPALAAALRELLLGLAALAAEPAVAMAEVNPAIWDEGAKTLWVVDARWQPPAGAPEPTGSRSRGSG
jgi:acetyltransferase